METRFHRARDYFQSNRSKFVIANNLKTRDLKGIMCTPRYRERKFIRLLTHDSSIADFVLDFLPRGRKFAYKNDEDARRKF